MTPQITNWDDLAFALEEVDPESKVFHYTSFGLLDDNDTFYYGQLDAFKTEISFDQLMAALNSVPDDTIYPLWLETELHEAPETQHEDIYIKRRPFELYGILKKQGMEKQLFKSLISEASVLEVLSHHPHPNLVRYHGCRVKRGYITGLILDKHPHDLLSYVEIGNGKIDRVPFMAALESAIQHLHDLGFAHNDLTPSNILVTEKGMPILIDFEGCQQLGTELKYIRGTKEWIEGEIGDHNISAVRHDDFALQKIDAWLDDQDSK
ncbi:hypothetical protein N7448_003678 [Penicillium atrosanguineum]|uniref:Uncharacterized protein n=1 Tax=Penicillium atrosanguineum TaxID=1132637 RepID=A0A9W9H7U3_9EURO|nr:uncharacterized protein N7443_002648 [Penicillium atrosanguineum]KAJ5140270.1 hypothetical protein N7448_003678 [Penicillium atrosanguineum]KAJ5310187.1 hypothetical protein N7443_002648 [Penicillium atrosanguineum]KAJ5315703.1 hypothetical protein N7476_006010 [Penicillium atrosanguineum]